MSLLRFSYLLVEAHKSKNLYINDLADNINKYLYVSSEVDVSEFICGVEPQLVHLPFDIKNQATELLNALKLHVDYVAW